MPLVNSKTMVQLDRLKYIKIEQVTHHDTKKILALSKLTITVTEELEVHKGALHYYYYYCGTGM